MIDIFTKLDSLINYDDNYSILKAFSTLEKEFNMCVTRKDKRYAYQIVYAANKLAGKLSLLFGNSGVYSSEKLVKISSELVRNFGFRINKIL